MLDASTMERIPLSGISFAKVVIFFDIYKQYLLIR